MERLAQCSMLAIILVHFLIYALSSPDGFLFVSSTHIFLFLFLYFFSWWRIPICTEHSHIQFLFLLLFFIFKCFLVSCKGWAWLFGEIGLDVNNSVCRVSALLGMCKVHNLFWFAKNSLWCYINFGSFWIKIYIYMCIIYFRCELQCWE